MQQIRSRLSIVLILAIALLSAACEQQESADTATEMEGDMLPGIPEEEQAIGETVDAVLAGFGFEEDVPAEYETVRTYFTDSGMLGLVEGDSLKMRTVDEYIEEYREWRRYNDVYFMREIEVAARTEYYGSIAQRFSSYVAYVNDPDTAAQSGMITTQLVKLDGDWLVQSMIRTEEIDGNPIPEEFRE